MTRSAQQNMDDAVRDRLQRKARAERPQRTRRCSLCSAPGARKVNIAAPMNLTRSERVFLCEDHETLLNETSPMILNMIYEFGYERGEEDWEYHHAFSEERQYG